MYSPHYLLTTDLYNLGIFHAFQPLSLYLVPTDVEFMIIGLEDLAAKC